MAKLTKSVSNTIKGRIPNQKLGGRAIKPFLRHWFYPSPATYKTGKKNER